MTRVDFYFNAPDRLHVACRLAGKALAAGERMLVYAPEADLASRVDRLMWTSPASGFVPHCAADDPLAPDTPVVIARGEDAPGDFSLLLNLGAECPPHFARFERLLEVVSTDEQDRAAARERHRQYKSRGYASTNHDLARDG
jgi:DNA polymerase III subunit chi